MENWTFEEKELFQKVLNGLAVVVNVHSKSQHQNLIQWAKRNEFFIYIGRANPRLGLKKSIWCNPFKIDGETDRMKTLELYHDYLMKNVNLLEAIPTLRGNVLGCWCAPLACHGDILASIANNEPNIFLKGERTEYE